MLGLVYGLSFWIQAASHFPQSWVKKKTGLIFYLADFYGWNWRIPGYSENNSTLSLFSTKTNYKGFILFGPKILQLSITWHKLSSELSRRLGLKVGFKELRLEPKFLNRGLFKTSGLSIDLYFIQTYQLTKLFRYPVVVIPYKDNFNLEIKFNQKSQI